VKPYLVTVLRDAFAHLAKMLSSPPCGAQSFDEKCGRQPVSVKDRQDELQSKSASIDLAFKISEVALHINGQEHKHRQLSSLTR